MYNLGTILLYLATGIHFSDTSIYKEFVDDVRQEFLSEEFWAKYEEHSKKFLSFDLKELINGMICYDRLKRLSLEQVMSNKWLKSNKISPHFRN